MVNISEDLAKALLSIIDLSSKAGVFVGGNLSIAGQVRSELEASLNATTKAPTPTAEKASSK